LLACTQIARQYIHRHVHARCAGMN
jgi:hypothetical protein